MSPKALLVVAPVDLMRVGKPRKRKAGSVLVFR
jgi:hypothetical protein